MSPLEALAEANAAGVRAYCSALADQKWQDTGTCGYGQILVQAASPLGRAAVEAGKGVIVPGRRVMLRFDVPPGVRRVQTMTVNVAATRAMADHLRKAGFEDVELNEWVD